MAACVENSRTQIGNCVYKLCSRSSISGRTCSDAAASCIDVVEPRPAKKQEQDQDQEEEEEDRLWLRIIEEARSDMEEEPILRTYFTSSILSFESLSSALANQLAQRLSGQCLSPDVLYSIFAPAFAEDKSVMAAVKADLMAAGERDPACVSLVHCLLHYKGFLAVQAHRVANKLWLSGRRAMALLIQNRVSEVFAVDIHPGATVGAGILLDHATGVVVGETAVIGDNVSILHNVTLGGTGKVSGDRHPKIGSGVLVGAGTQILGNVRIGDGAKIGAGSVVLKEVPAFTTAVGNPARLVGGKVNPIKLGRIASSTMDHTSYVDHCFDYVI